MAEQEGPEKNKLTLRNETECCDKSDGPNSLYKDLKSTQWPIVYSPEYNISFFGLEKLHPFDSGKWGRAVGFLTDSGVLTSENFITPIEPNDEQLKEVHTKEYLDSLKAGKLAIDRGWAINIGGGFHHCHGSNGGGFCAYADITLSIRWSWKVAAILEVPPVAFLPNVILQRVVLRRLRLQTGGTILAGKLAIDRGWAINIGGGFHHCHGSNGGGFCAYADITLSIRFLCKNYESVCKAMIIDLDAHQGNGHERDFVDDESVYIMDVYNSRIYPGDTLAKSAIRKKVELNHKTEDSTYLPLVERNMKEALHEFHPDIIVYNAGTDILEDDPLGNLSITAQGIITRDEMVFRAARERNIPIFMVTSGGYQRRTAKVIADSITNLYNQGLISCNYSLCPKALL